ISLISAASQLAILIFEATDTYAHVSKQEILMSTHPTHWTRLFGSLATLMFLVYPLPSTSIDPRINPLESSMRNKYGIDIFHNWLATLIELYEAAKDFLITLNLEPSKLIMRRGEYEQIALAILTSRMGLVFPGHKIFNEADEIDIFWDTFYWGGL